MKYFPYVVSNEYSKLKELVSTKEVNIIGFITFSGYQRLVRIYRPINADYISFSTVGWSLEIFDNEDFEMKCREYYVKYLIPTEVEE